MKYKNRKKQIERQTERKLKRKNLKVIRFQIALAERRDKQAEALAAA